MDIWGGVWLIIAMISFPFGYKPIIAILSISSIFQASKMVTLGGVNLPLFFCIECLAFLRLCIPFKNSGMLAINNKKVFLIFILVFLIWFQTFFNTYIFEGIRVFSSLSGSNEYSVAKGGIPLSFSSANINQLILLTMHLFLAAALYARRDYLDKYFYFKTIIASILIFSFFGLIWRYSNGLYNAVSLIALNNDLYAVNVFNENRLSGTFSEPSFAGLFIGSFCIPFILYKNKFIKLVGLLLLFLASLNLSSTLVFAILVSIALYVMHSGKEIQNKILILILSFMFFLLIYITFYDYISFYVDNKASSDSGNTRSAVNLHALSNIFNSYFMGLGLGSERASSLILTMFNNLGIILSFLLLLFVYRLINRDSSKVSSLLFLCLTSCFFGSFASMQEITIPFLWNLIFANIATGTKNQDIK